jgi:hypothetical protein
MERVLVVQNYDNDPTTQGGSLTNCRGAKRRRIATIRDADAESSGAEADISSITVN